MCLVFQCFFLLIKSVSYSTHIAYLWLFCTFPIPSSILYLLSNLACVQHWPIKQWTSHIRYGYNGWFSFIWSLLCGKRKTANCWKMMVIKRLAVLYSFYFLQCLYVRIYVASVEYVQKFIKYSLKVKFTILINEAWIMLIRPTALYVYTLYSTYTYICILIIAGAIIVIWTLRNLTVAL